MWDSIFPRFSFAFRINFDQMFKGSKDLYLCGLEIK